MRLLIDADGCPVVEIALRVCRAKGIPVIIVKNYEHRIESDYAEVITVDKGRDTADFRIVNLMAPGDVVITQDHGLAAMVLARGGRCLSQSGMEIDAGNIDRLLERRHLHQELRRKHGIYGARFRKRTREDDAVFEQALKALLKD